MQEPRESPKDKIKSHTIERDFCSGLIKYPEIIYIIDGWISERDFASPVASKVFSIVRHLIIEKQLKSLDSAILLATISNFNYTFPKECNISDYITILIKGSEGMETKTVELLAREIVLLSKRREMWDCGTRLQQNMMSGHTFGNIQEIISVADEIYLEAINKFVVEDDGVMLGQGAGEFLHQRADNPVDHLGFSSGLKYYDEMIGYFRPDSFNFISARNKVGKSMLGLNIAAHVAIREKMPVFYADSEMDNVLMRARLIAHIAGVDVNLVETGRWAHNPEVCARVKKAIPIIEAANIEYHSIRATNVTGMISACRRFLFRRVKRASNQVDFNPCLFVWDYIKLDYYNEKSLGNNWWLDMAKSVVHFKDFLGATKTAALVLGQQNQQGIAKLDKDKKMVTADNEGVVAGTDEISKTASNISQLRFKTPEEIKRDGSENGNAMLMPFACRTGGGGAWVQLSEGVFEREYVCLEREKEKMTFREITTNRIIRERQNISHALK